MRQPASPAGRHATVAPAPQTCPRSPTTRHGNSHQPAATEGMAPGLEKPSGKCGQRGSRDEEPPPRPPDTHMHMCTFPGRCARTTATTTAKTRRTCRCVGWCRLPGVGCGGVAPSFSLLNIRTEKLSDAGGRWARRRFARAAPPTPSPVEPTPTDTSTRDRPSVRARLALHPRQICAFRYPCARPRPGKVVACRYSVSTLCASRSRCVGWCRFPGEGVGSRSHAPHLTAHRNRVYASTPCRGRWAHG